MCCFSNLFDQRKRSQLYFSLNAEEILEVSLMFTSVIIVYTISLQNPGTNGQHEIMEANINQRFKGSIFILRVKTWIKFVKLVTVVEDHQKAPFSIAITLKCRGRRYSFPWISPLYP